MRIHFDKIDGKAPAILIDKKANAVKIDKTRILNNGPLIVVKEKTYIDQNYHHDDRYRHSRCQIVFLVS